MTKQLVKGSIGANANFLLSCSDSTLASYELARLGEVANLRSEMQEILDRLIDTMSQAALAAWFRKTDRETLKRALDNPEDVMAWAAEQVRDRQRSEKELVPRTSLEPGVAHLASALRYQERNIAEGKCAICPEPLDGNSVRYCTRHLVMARDREQQKKGVRSDPGSREYLYSGELTPSTHGRQPGTLASLEMGREKRTRALLAELGIPPESAAVSLKAAKDALMAHMPNTKTDAMTQAELFEKASIPTKTTGGRALQLLRSMEMIERIGKGICGNPFRYFANELPEHQNSPVESSPKRKHPSKRKNEALLKLLRGEESSEE